MCYLRNRLTQGLSAGLAHFLSAQRLQCLLNVACGWGKCRIGDNFLDCRAHSVAQRLPTMLFSRAQWSQQQQKRKHQHRTSWHSVSQSWTAWSRLQLCLNLEPAAAGRQRVIFLLTCQLKQMHENALALAQACDHSQIAIVKSCLQRSGTLRCCKADWDVAKSCHRHPFIREFRYVRECGQPGVNVVTGKAM